MVVLAHLQGVAVTFRVGRHHHRGPLHEGQGLTHALTDTAPTDLTVAAALVRKAYSKRRRSRLSSKPVNLRTWGLVSDLIVMVQAFVELRYGVVVHMRENSVKYGHNFIGQTLYKRETDGTQITRGVKTNDRYIHVCYDHWIKVEKVKRAKIHGSSHIGTRHQLLGTDSRRPRSITIHE
jgi:hypothetical protein